MARDLERKRSGSGDFLEEEEKGKEKEKEKKGRKRRRVKRLKPILEDEQYKLGRTGAGPPDPQEGGKEAGGGHGGAPGPCKGHALRERGRRRTRGRQLEVGRGGEADAVLPAVLEGEVCQQTSRPSRAIFAGPMLRLTAAGTDQRSGRCPRGAHHGLRGRGLQRKLEYGKVSGSGNDGLRQPRSSGNPPCCSKTCPPCCQIRAGLDFVERQRQSVRQSRRLDDFMERERKRKRKEREELVESPGQGERDREGEGEGRHEGEEVSFGAPPAAAAPRSVGCEPVPGVSCGDPGRGSRAGGRGRRRLARGCQLLWVAGSVACMGFFERRLETF